MCFDYVLPNILNILLKIKLIVHSFQNNTSNYAY